MLIVLTVPPIFSQSESPSDPSVFTTPGDVSPVAEYDVGKLLVLHVD